MKTTLKYLLLISVCFAFGFTWRDLSRNQAPSARSIGALLGVRITGQDLPADKVFRQNYNFILANHSRQIKPDDLKYAGIQGMLASLGDPHTVFLEPVAAKEFAEDTRGNFSGVGASLGDDPLGAKVVRVFEDGPAFRAGVRDNDLIIRVDGKPIAGVRIDRIVSMIKGPEATVVRLTVMRTGKPDPLTFSIRRARIVAPTVMGKLLPDQVGYLQIISFAEPTPLQFDRELERLEAQGIRGLVIDVRGNPGGLLDTAKEILSRFFENKLVVKMKLRSGEISERTESFMRREFPYPIVVLINEESASAAEIFAGCLRDYKVATLVGEHTYGKASVQNVFPLVDKASAKITIAKYYLPSGEFIGRIVDEDGVYVSGGLQPDVPVEFEFVENARFGEPENDNQLRKAIEIVRQKR